MNENECRTADWYQLATDADPMAAPVLSYEYQCRAWIQASEADYMRGWVDGREFNTKMNSSECCGGATAPALLGASISVPRSRFREDGAMCRQRGTGSIRGSNPRQVERRPRCRAAPGATFTSPRRALELDAAKLSPCRSAVRWHIGGLGFALMVSAAFSSGKPH
jgi:hypothetical protein